MLLDQLLRTHPLRFLTFRPCQTPHRLHCTLLEVTHAGEEVLKLLQQLTPQQRQLLQPLRQLLHLPLLLMLLLLLLVLISPHHPQVDLSRAGEALFVRPQYLLLILLLLLHLRRQRLRRLPVTYPLLLLFRLACRPRRLALSQTRASALQRYSFAAFSTRWQRRSRIVGPSSRRSSTSTACR